MGSILAKDEEYKNKNFNYQAIRAAIFVDKALVLALFTENHKTEKGGVHSINIHKLLKGFLSHPLTGDIKPDSFANQIETAFSPTMLIDNYYSSKTFISNVFNDFKD